MQEAYFGLPRVQSACLFRIELKAKGIFHLAKRFSVAKMSPLCDCGGEHVQKLNQQVYVMRKEIKNLRQMLDNAIRAHRKHVTSLQSAVTKLGVCDHDKDETPPPASPASVLASFEKGNIQTVPIGYISSCFSEKNGTPRQPTICGPSRAELRIRLSVFNNPEHALVGLEHFSHVWIIFLFHKNGHQSYKAKVKPPRLNGERVGLYSTRSPHRPNALGLTLAKLDKIEGDTIHLSDIDMIAGTPVLDIKPYIPKYDSPHTRGGMDSEPFDSNTDKEKASTVAEKVDISDFQKDRETEAQSDLESKRTNTQNLGSCLSREEVDIPDTGSSEISAPFSIPKNIQSVLQNVKTYVTQADICPVNCESESQVLNPNKTKPLESTMHYPCFGTETYSTIADWIKQPPVGNLVVRFTPHAEKELAKFLPSNQSGSSQQDGPRFKFLRSPKEAAAAIRGVLSADPRSVYRRTRCRDRLFFFTLDTADITCWFGEGFAEVVQVRAMEEHNASKRQTFSVNAS